MNIKVAVKQLGRKRDKVSFKDFFLQNVPTTVEELIKESVCTCVREYNQRVDENETVKVLSKEQIEDMSELGKIAFGINYGGKKADMKDAVDVAVQAFEDGLVRIFIGDYELEELSQFIDLKDDDLVTFIRLTMLAGTLF